MARGSEGVTSAVGLDFRTGLGQLLQGMTDDSVKYAVAVPGVEKFIKQCSRVSPWVRQTLGLYWLFVNSAGQVKVVGPEQAL